jgi:hypothetical protein
MADSVLGVHTPVGTGEVTPDAAHPTGPRS